MAETAGGSGRAVRPAIGLAVVSALAPASPATRLLEPFSRPAAAAIEVAPP
jgi:hypothetical protein